MKAKFRVHSVVRSRVTKQVEVNGETVPADVWGLEVEMVDENGASYTRRFIGQAAKDAEATFKKDAEFEVSFVPYGK